MHYAGTALSGLAVNREGTATGPRHRDFDWDSAATADDLERIGPDRVAAFFCEPVIGAGGVFPPPEGYLADVRKICTEYDVLFVADEVVTGYGRIGGSWFASTQFGLEPDIMTTAKGLSQRLPADRRRARSRRRSPSRSSSRAATCGGATATPTPATRRPARWRSATWPSWSAKDCSTKLPSGGAAGDGSDHWPTTSGSKRCAAG